MREVNGIERNVASSPSELYRAKLESYKAKTYSLIQRKEEIALLSQDNPNGFNAEIFSSQEREVLDDTFFKLLALKDNLPGEFMRECIPLIEQIEKTRGLL